MSEVDCDVRFLAMPNADAYLWVRDQPVDQVLLTRALNPPVRETPITYIRVHLGGAGMHAGVKQALDVQPLRARMVLVADGAGSGELAGLAKYYDMPVAASGVPDGDALGTGRLLSVDGEGRELDGAGDGAVWGLSPARVAAREVLRTALGGGGTREPSWPDLVRFLERAKEIRRKWGAAGQPGDAAEYVVGAALAYRGVGAGVDAAALARQVLPLAPEQVSGAVGDGAWVGGGDQLVSGLLDSPGSAAVVWYRAAGVGRPQPALVLAGGADRVGLWWVEPHIDEEPLVPVDVTGNGWRAQVLRSARTEVWWARTAEPPALDTTVVQAPALDTAIREALTFAGQESIAAQRPSFVVEDGGLRLDLYDFLAPRLEDRAGRWVLYERLLRLALAGTVTGDQMRSLAAGVRGEQIEIRDGDRVKVVDYGSENAKMFAAIGAVLDVDQEHVGRLWESEEFKTMLAAVSGCDVGPEEKYQWIRSMKEFREAGARLGLFSKGKVGLLKLLVEKWVNCDPA